MKALYQQIGRSLRNRRETAGLTQTELAARVGLSRTSVTNIEQGRQHLTLHVLYAFADALGALPAELLPDPNSLASRDPGLDQALTDMALPDSEREWIHRVFNKSKAQGET